RKARVRDRVAHRHPGVGRRIAHEALALAVDLRVEIDRRHAGDLAAQAQLCVFGRGGDAAAALAQRARDLVELVAEAGDDAHAGHDYAAHQLSSRSLNRPTRMLLTT